MGPGELAVARGRQRNLAGWVARRRAGTRTADAAEHASRTSGAADHAPAAETRGTEDVARADATGTDDKGRDR